MAYIGLHNHSDRGSNLRLRDSINKIPDMIEYAHELGHKGICFTEHESITSSLTALKYYKQYKDNPEWTSFKIVLGNEIYLCTDDVVAGQKNRYPHFILIALNANGHKGIRELSTNSWLNNSFKTGKMMRVPTYYRELEEKMEYYKGDIVGSSACLGGALPYRLLQYRDLEINNPVEYKEIWSSCIEWVDYMNEIFGKGYFFLELQPSITDEQIYINKKLVQLSQETGTPFIITTDSHYLKKEDREVHRMYLNAQEGDREVDSFYGSTYIMSEEEIHEYMDKYLGYEVVNQGINNTMLVYDMVQEYELEKELSIPYLPTNTNEPDKDLYDKYKNKIELLDYFYHSPYNCDRHLVRDILNYLDKDKNYQTQKGYIKINECFEALKVSSDKMNLRWSAYLLQLADYVQIAWNSESLVGAGRGSGVGFCFLHMLGITQINPLLESTETFGWRFLNPERASVLDIDVDVEGNKRDVIIDNLDKTYSVNGEKRVSKVMTLATEKSRGAILTAARGLGIDNAIAQYISSLIVSDRGQLRTLKQMYYGDEDYEPVQEFVNEVNKYPKLWDMAQKIEGLVSGVGSHAGGVIITDKPFTDVTALMRTNSGDIITQYDLHECEDVSLIKIDLLCIDALEKIHTCLDLLLKYNKIQWQGNLKKTYEKYLGIYTLERKSVDMWDMLINHKVISFFQMEKDSGIQAIALSKPQSVDDLAALNSVMRLMAQNKNEEIPLHKFARFKNNINEWYKEMSDYGLTLKEQEILKRVVGVSYGICQSQEQLMMLVQLPEAGGFSLSWADQLRKAVAKKQPKQFMKLEQEFLKNAEEKQLSQNFIRYIWFVLIYTQRGLTKLAHVKLCERMQKRCDFLKSLTVKICKMTIPCQVFFYKKRKV